MNRKKKSSPALNEGRQHPMAIFFFLSFFLSMEKEGIFFLKKKMWFMQKTKKKKLTKNFFFWVFTQSRNDAATCERMADDWEQFEAWIATSPRPMDRREEVLLLVGEIRAHTLQKLRFQVR